MQRIVSTQKMGYGTYIACCLMLISLALLPGRSSWAQEVRHHAPLILAGVYLEQNASLHPGLAMSYTSSTFMGGHPRLSVSYATTRLATAFGSHALAEDRLLTALGWYFRPRRKVDLYLKLALGYARFDREDPELFALLDNDAPVANLGFGVEMRPSVRRLGVYGEIGYAIIQSSIVYPPVLAFGININLKRRMP